ncbi:hypothetical protein M0811_14110 [Anaeramoeba ignava]|uniref:Uncharacterized protein n=1 Tax=Anaeramoeba ignava TaxID=1746090 RepID=A0A9Q0LZJ6_ANAIG|nr:hypothetical protein M0811_14110 [Anaeramoeba ignava]
MSQSQNANINQLCSFLLKYKWCHSYQHFKLKNHAEHPPKNVLCPNIVKYGSCRDSNCPYQHVNPKNKYYNQIVQNADPNGELHKVKRENCYYWCDLQMKDQICSNYANSGDCPDLNCLFQHHTDKNFVRKDPVIQKHTPILPKQRDKKTSKRTGKPKEKKTIDDLDKFYKHLTKKVNQANVPMYAKLCPSLLDKKDNTIIGCTNPTCLYAHPNPEAIIKYKHEFDSNWLNTMSSEYCEDYGKTFICTKLSCKKQHINYLNNLPEEEPQETDNSQPLCPYLMKTGYCRIQTVRDYTSKDKRLVCNFRHNIPPTLKIKQQDAKLEDLKTDNPIYIDIEKKFKHNWTYGTVPTVIKIQKINNPYLSHWFNRRKLYLEERRKKIFAVNELYHGTDERYLKTIMDTGFYIVSNYNANPKCKSSGYKENKNQPSFCNIDCPHCIEKHVWNKCHMYGLGIYLTLCTSKSDKYVKATGSDRKLFLCDVSLGESYYHKESLQKQDAAHDWVLPPDGYDSITVPGTGSTSPLNVMNNEFIIFHKFQAIPRYLITYK